MRLSFAFFLLATTVACNPWSVGEPDTQIAADTGFADTGVADTEPADTSTDVAADTSNDTGSDADAGPTGTPLVSNDAWAPVDEADDPLKDHRPDSVECPDEAVTTEDLQGESTRTVDTTKCNYYTAQQPLLEAVEEGEELSVRVWHFDLTYMAPTEAHVALLIDGSVVWEERVPIPSGGGGLLSKTWQAEADYPAGATVTLHLHNHGSNTWNFIELEKEGSR
jgi:hypothetical protein